jgi:hypothetical protein
MSNTNFIVVSHFNQLYNLNQMNIYPVDFYNLLDSYNINQLLELLDIEQILELLNIDIYQFFENFHFFDFNIHIDIDI